MSAAAWATGAQILLSAVTGIATVAIGFAVYRVQADKLFLEMRTERIAALERFRASLLARHDHTFAINFENIEQMLKADTLERLLKTHVAAQRDLALWFGSEVAEAATAADTALEMWAQKKIAFHSQSVRRPHGLDEVMEYYWKAERALTDVMAAARPYIAADRRGLPFTMSLRLWRRR